MTSVEQAPIDALKGTTSASQERLATLYSATHLLNPMVFSISTLNFFVFSFLNLSFKYTSTLRFVVACHF